MGNKINEITSSEFRTKIKSLGFTENKQELTSGGELNSGFLDILNQFFTEWKTIGGNGCLVMFTSGNDNFHKTVGYTSQHTKGNAVDVTLNSGCHSKFITLLNSYKSKYNGFSYIDEYTNPSAKSTGGHFHISYTKGKPENTSTTGDTTSLSGGTTTPDSDTDQLVKSMSDMSMTQSIFDTAKDTASTPVNEEINRIKKLMK